MGYNDTSLEYGGLRDIGPPYGPFGAPPANFHSIGRDQDGKTIPADAGPGVSGIPLDKKSTPIRIWFESQVRALLPYGDVAFEGKNQHYHIYGWSWPGGAAHAPLNAQQ